MNTTGCFSTLRAGLAGVIILGSIAALQAQEPATVTKYDRMALDPSLHLKDEENYRSRAELKLEERRIDSEIHRLTSLTKKVLKGDSEFGPNRDSLDRFLGRYFLPRMTHYDDMSISAGKLRDDLIRNYLNKSYNAQARDHVLDNIINRYAKRSVLSNQAKCVGNDWVRYCNGIR